MISETASKGKYNLPRFLRSGIFPRWLWILLGILSLSTIGIYFRTYPLHGGGAVTLSKFYGPKARDIAFGNLKRQLRTILDQQAPQIPDATKDRMVEDRANMIVSSEPESFEKVVRTLAENMVGWQPRRQSRTYLLEADPFYYYYFTKQIVETGRIGIPAVDQTFIHPLRRAPMGVRERMMWHPFLGAYWYQFLKLFHPHIELMRALCYFPLVLCVVMVFVFFLLGKILRFKFFSAFMGCLVLVLSPMVIQRDAFGWFDTDPYNLIFPMAILAFFFASVQQASKRRLFFMAFLSGLLTGIYAMFWGGWPFIFLLTLFGGFIVGLVQGWRQKKFLCPYMLTTFGYVYFSLLSLTILMTPVGLLSTFVDAMLTIPKYAANRIDLWPTVFLTVGEAAEAPLLKIIFLSANPVTIAVALVGFFGTLFSIFKDKDTTRFYEWLVFALCLVSLIILSHQTERFTLLFVFPMAVFVAFGVEWLDWLVQKFSSRFLADRRISLKLVRGIVACLIFFLIAPYTLLLAHVVSLRLAPIMDDTWYDSLIALRDKTPPDSVVHSWWPPGHFITSIANRRVSIDGGAQHLLDTYWIAKALFTGDEFLSAALFRYVDAGSTGAISFLQERGMKPSRITSLIMEILTLPPSQAMEKLPASFSLPEKKQLVALVQGRANPPPTYVYVYNDLIEQNIAASLIATWNFEKAEKARKEQEVAQRVNPFLLFVRTKFSYMQQVVSLTDGLLKYRPEAPLLKQEGNRLFFADGVRVDLSTMDSYAELPDSGAHGQPMSLFYLENGNLVEKENFSDRMIDSSALIYPHDNTYYSVLADRRLIKSMLFRFYYLNGVGLKYFKPFYGKEDKVNKTSIYIFEIDWNAFERDLAAKEREDARQTEGA